MRHRLGAALAIALMAGAIGGCGDDGDGAAESSTTPSARLEAAVEKTLAVETMVITMGAGGGGSETITEYQAPDRARTSMDGMEVRIIGNVTYIPWGRPGEWMSRTTTGKGPFGPLFELELLKNPAQVTEDGARLVVQLRGGHGSAHVELRDGYVIRSEQTLEGGSEPFTSVIEFSRFDEPVDPIEAPPADKVTKQAEEQKPTEPKEATLPPPVGPTDSTVQLRGVIDDSSTGCASSSANPAASSTARLASTDGTCFELGASDLELSTVKAIKAVEDEGGAVRVDITLHEADADRFDVAARKHYGQRLALVAFGQVLSAPSVMTEKFGGRATIPGLTPALASRLVAALS